VFSAIRTIELYLRFARFDSLYEKNKEKKKKRRRKGEETEKGREGRIPYAAKLNFTSIYESIINSRLHPGDFIGS